jgi:hypothetical protein
VSVLPTRCRRHLVERNIAFDEIDGPQKGIILKSYEVPRPLFDANRADILILLPDGYPDVRPDMFFVMPWLRLVSSGAYPKAADQPFEFAGRNWQRWSRHQDQWRPGIDGIWTMLRRIDAALEAAA